MDGIDQSPCRPVTESLLHVGDVVVRCEDAARTRVQVIKPFVGDMRVTQILNPCHLLTRSSGVQSICSSVAIRFSRRRGTAALGAVVH